MQSHGVLKSTHKLVVPMAMQTPRHGRQQAALLAMEPFFTNSDLLSLVIKEALPAAALHAVCKQWRALADAEWVWKSKCVERFPATAGLVGVSSYKDLLARLSGHTVHVAAQTAQPLPPGLGEYQFLVRLTAGEEVLLDTCLSGADAASQPTFSWMTSLEHRRVLWPVALPCTAVMGLAEALRADSLVAAEEFSVTVLGAVLDAVAERESGEAPWRVSVTTFRAADQRCEVLLAGGCREVLEQGYPPSDRVVGFQGLELTSDPDSCDGNAGCSLDAFALRQRGIEIADSAGSAWFVPNDNVYDEDYCEPSRLFYQVTLLPHLRSSGSIGWELELDLECDGPAAGEDGLWNGAYLGGSVQHCVFLEGLNEKAVTCDETCGDSDCAVCHSLGAS